MRIWIFYLRKNFSTMKFHSTFTTVNINRKIVFPPSFENHFFSHEFMFAQFYQGFIRWVGENKLFLGENKFLDLTLVKGWKNLPSDFQLFIFPPQKSVLFLSANTQFYVCFCWCGLKFMAAKYCWPSIKLKYFFWFISYIFIS